MAHECPECGNKCYCKGDVGDLVLNLDQYTSRCNCCLIDYDDDDEYWNAHPEYKSNLCDSESENEAQVIMQQDNENVVAYTEKDEELINALIYAIMTTARDQRVTAVHAIGALEFAKRQIINLCGTSDEEEEKE